MLRGNLLLAAIEIGGGRLLVSTFGLTPILGYGVIMGTLAILVAIRTWCASRSHPN